MAKAKDEFTPGDVLGGKYRIERVIGKGGMGVVVAARHTELHQRVAIKLLPAEHAKDPELVSRFMREARAAVRLRSEHSVKVMDVGTRADGAPYIVMELLEGEDLGAALDRGALSIPDALDFVLQACEAIAEAHALGIVHRDLKPRNLFLTSRLHGRALVKVLDFGLAKRIDVQDHALTATAAVMGSPQYMSPEQMKASRDVDFRTDIWSIGVCLYELISGRTPFDAPAVPVLCAMVLKDDPAPLTSVTPNVPEELWQVIRKCLAKDRSDRYTTIFELAVALEPFAPLVARGASARIEAVLASVPSELARAPISDQPPRDAKEETRTAATFDPGGSRDRGAHLGWYLALASVIALVGFVGVVLIRQTKRAREAQSATLAESSASSTPAISAPRTSRETFVLQGPRAGKEASSPAEPDVGVEVATSARGATKGAVPPAAPPARSPAAGKPRSGTTSTAVKPEERF